MEEQAHVAGDKSGPVRTGTEEAHKACAEVPARVDAGDDRRPGVRGEQREQRVVPVEGDIGEDNPGLRDSLVVPSECCPADAHGLRALHNAAPDPAASGAHLAGEMALAPAEVQEGSSLAAFGHIRQRVADDVCQALHLRLFGRLHSERAAGRAARVGCKRALGVEAPDDAHAASEKCQKRLWQRKGQQLCLQGRGAVHGPGRSADDLEGPLRRESLREVEPRRREHVALAGVEEVRGQKAREEGVCCDKSQDIACDVHAAARQKIAQRCARVPSEHTTIY